MGLRAGVEGLYLLHLVEIVALEMRLLEHGVILHLHYLCVVLFVPDYCLVL